MLTIDGAAGEGGGQILRSSLALSMLTGKPFRAENIRAGRAKPGLMRQHLTAVLAATRVSSAAVEGAEIGSKTLTFQPNQPHGGDYVFQIGTAGSTTLVLQTILLPLLLADRSSRVVLEGGTHNPHAPPFDFLAAAYLPLINRMGPHVTAACERPGFFPAGGGRIVIDIEPAKRLEGFALLERGEMKTRRAVAAVAGGVPDHVAERELRTIEKTLGWSGSELNLRRVDGRGPGNVVTLTLEFEHVCEVFTGFGEVSRAAEAVATIAVDQCRRYLKRTAPVGEFLTDQLLLPLAVAGRGEFASTGLSPHATTHIELIQRFLEIDVATKRMERGETHVTIGQQATDGSRIPQ
ncbi:MAG: RNA 3'-terminal phosphate cyclase [Planctomycetota bacterium]